MKKSLFILLLLVAFGNQSKAQCPSPTGENVICDNQCIVGGAVPNIIRGSTLQPNWGTVQWQRRTVYSSTWTNILNAIGRDYQPPATNETTYYRRAVSIGGNFNMSNVVEVNVTGSIYAPLILAPAICAGNQFTVSINPVPGAQFYTWNLPPGFTIYGQAGVVHTQPSIHIIPIETSPSLSASTYTLKVWSNDRCGRGVQERPVPVDVYTAPISAGLANIEFITPSPFSPEVCPGVDFQIRATIPNASSSYYFQWVYGSGDYYIEPVGSGPLNQTGNPVTVTLRPGPNHSSSQYIILRIDNGCGYSANRIIYLPARANNCPYDPPYSYNVFPNPSDDYLEVTSASLTDSDTKEASLMESSHKEGNNSKEFQVQLYDNLVKLRKTGNSKGGKIKLDTRSLSPGMYYLHIIQGDKVTKRQVEIRR